MNHKTPSNKKIIFASLLLAFFLIVCIVSLVRWLKPTEKENKLTHNTHNIEQTTQRLLKNTNPSASITTIDDSKYSNQPSSQFTTGLEKLPNSLQGTSVDGEIIIDENKQLVVTQGLKRLFDYFLSALGEESSETIYARVESYINSHTPEPASSQAIALFHSYVKYLQATSNLEEKFGSLQMQATESGEFDSNLIKQRRFELVKLRQQYFDVDTIHAFFSQEDEREDYSLAMIEIGQNKKLVREEKLQEKQDYINRLPESADKKAMQQFNQQQADITALLQRTELLKQQGANAEQLYNMRVQMVGVEAAQRLAMVDTEENDYEHRFIEYQKQKQTLINQDKKMNTTNIGNTQYSAETQQQINNLEQSLFNEAERKRLAGYEAVRNSKKVNQNTVPE